MLLDEPLPEHYKTLGVESGASADDIKAAWRKIAKECHPDRAKAQGLDAAEAEKRRMRFIDAQGAWDVLRDEEKRKKYDENRALYERIKAEVLEEIARRKAAQAEARRQAVARARAEREHQERQREALRREEARLQAELAAMAASGEEPNAYMHQQQLWRELSSRSRMRGTSDRDEQLGAPHVPNLPAPLQPIPPAIQHIAANASPPGARAVLHAAHWRGVDHQAVRREAEQLFCARAWHVLQRF